MLVGGPLMTCGCLMAFFGGSDRDPGWVWALFIACFYGGQALGVAGLLMLVILGFQKPVEPPPFDVLEPSSDGNQSEKGDR